MAAGSEVRLRNRLTLGKKLPPVTLSNTSISGLLTLVPVLVAMTSRTATPRFEEEEDKPPWWPRDVQWKNPKDYCYMGDPLLRKLLRKVIHSCYTYHGVEDLLIRLDDSQKMEGDHIDMSDVELLMDGNNSAPDNDGPVFVCCFCLEEFDSHKNVSAHQRVCQDKSQSVADDLTQNLPSRDSVENYTDVHNQQLSSASLSKKQSGQSELSNRNNALPPHPVSLSVVLHSLPNRDLSVGDVVKVSKPPMAVTTTTTRAVARKDSGKSTVPSSKRQPSSSSKTAIVPTLKTRSQKKLDQIMERHNMKKMMIQECRDLKEVPKAGAWWVDKRTRRKPRPPASVHPCEELTKHEFFSGMGLSLKKLKSEPSEESSTSKKEVDLDCEIISVEGPLSMKLHPFVEGSSNEHNTATSPRASKSLMSQMSRDDSSRSSARRRISSLCFVEDEWADREAINEGRDPRQISLLTLDLSSPLGQRVKKFVKVDRPMNVVKDVELCSNTECDESKLRIRSCDFKVTFRKKCRATSWVHKYKFNKYQVREFRRNIRTGLSKRSRYLMRRMQNCRVTLRQMTERDIDLYNKEKKVTIAENILVDDDLCITQIDIPEAGLQHLKNHSHPKSAPSGFSHGGNPNPRPSLSSSSHHALPFRQCNPSHSQAQPRHHHHHHQSRHPHYNLPLNNHHHHQPSSSSRGPHLPPRPFSLNPRSSNHSPSPPHIPNIFRNRSNSNTPSPPRHFPRDGKDSHLAYQKALSSLHSSSSHSPSNCSQNHQSHQPENRHHHHHHHPQHRHHHHHQHNHHHQQKQDSGTCSPPLGFSTGVIISQRLHHRKPPVSNTTNSRRKQPMNHVRHDDSFNDVAQKNPHTSSLHPSTTKQSIPNSQTTKDSRKTETFINLIDETSPSSPPSSSLPSSSSSSSSPLSKGKQSSQINNDTKDSQGQSKDLSQLSNFEYFSIKQGKVSPGHSLPPSIYNANKQHRNSPQTQSQPDDSHSELKHRNGPLTASPSHHHHHHQQQQQCSNFDKQRQQQQQPTRPHQSHNNNDNLNQGSDRNTGHLLKTKQQQSSDSSNHLPRNPPQSVDTTTDDDVSHRQNTKRNLPHKLGPKSFQLARSGGYNHHHPPRPLLPANKSTSNKPTQQVDDDVMEIICID